MIDRENLGKELLQLFANPQFKELQRIICMTEEGVEVLFDLGQSHKIVGVSQYAVRPPEVKKIAQVCSFLQADAPKIVQLQPDLVLGYSDVQKQLAADLIDRGISVYLANHRTIAGIFQYIQMLGGAVGVERKRIDDYIQQLLTHLQQIREKAELFRQKEAAPKVYFEEWDSPMIAGGGWISEMIEWCGGRDIAKEKAFNFKAKERQLDIDFVVEQNPDIIFLCWCGKPGKIDQVMGRRDFQKIKAVQTGRIFELPPEIFLQPGPAFLKEAGDILLSYMYK